MIGVILNYNYLLLPYNNNYNGFVMVLPWKLQAGGVEFDSCLARDSQTPIKE